MQEALINILLAFLEGFALIISPCILPVLPIVLSGSLTGSKSRPLGIVCGFIFTFTVFTLFSRTIIQYTHINQDLLRNISFGILFLLGIIMMSETLTSKFNLALQKMVSTGESLSTANDAQSGFFGGFLFGALAGIIWTPCAGPILAAVIVQVVIQKTTLHSLFVVMAFAIGAGLPMLFIALLGRGIMKKFDFFRDKTKGLRRLLGLILILTVFYLMFFSGMSTITYPKTERKFTSNTLINGLPEPYKAPEIEGIDAWINSPPLTLAELKNKVVLIDFWTYSCINCLRTLPYLKDWYAKYHDKGLEIIGVHSPEFQFEHALANVQAAVASNNIHYPVALDNQFTTWQNFQNRYWPAHYLIDKTGNVVYDHFGEGEYETTENNIRFLLGLGKMKPAKTEKEVFIQQTPETYLGYERAQRLMSPEVVVNNQTVVYSYPSRLGINEWALKGKWVISAEKIVSADTNAAIKIHFSAGKVYAVMGTSLFPVNVAVFLNDKLKNKIRVDQNKLYTLIDLQKNSEGILEMLVEGKGLEVYTFTFGNE